MEGDSARTCEAVGAVFLGTYTPRMDEKGRLILPAKYRDDLAEGLVLTRGQERCIYVFSTEEFQNVHQQMRQAPLTSRQARDYIRVFLSGASDETPDKQGRITIPSALREYAGLDRDVTVIGAGDRAEIWDSAAWNAYLEEKESEFSSTDEEAIPGIF
nr:division/cell wall cluster transcriptional repressor MraZ [Nesterenkonia xinjiangensis]